MSGRHRKNKTLVSNKKAFSSVVGAIFAVLVIVALTGTFFVWSLQQNTRYVNSVAEMNQLVSDQKKESINVTGTPSYIVVGSDVTVNVGIQNDGPISVIIKSLWLQDIDSAAYGKKELNAAAYTLSSGEAKSVAETVSIPGAADGHQFHGWFITARGSVIPLYPAHQIGPQGLKGDPGNDGLDGASFNETGDIHLFNGTDGDENARTALVSQGIGSISMDFKTLSVHVTDSLNNVISNSSAYTFSRTQRIAFSLNVTNMDSSTQFMNLTYRSCIWIFSPAAGAIKGNVWPLAKAVGNSITPLASNEFVILNYNVSTRIYFGPLTAGVSSLDAGITGVNLILTGKVGSYDYGQNLPFVSLIAT